MLNSVRPSPLPQIHAHYELKKTSRHRRNLAITGGVALSIITAPVIAAVSVGKKPDGAVRYYVSRSFEDDGQGKKKRKEDSLSRHITGDSLKQGKSFDAK